MSKSLNRWTGLGNVGKPPEIRSTPNGVLVANFSIAVTDRFKDSAGQWQDKTEWVNLAAFARTAEVVRDYVEKGSQVYVEGKLQTRKWQDKETGKDVYRTEILVNELILLGGKKDRPVSNTNPAPSAGAMGFPPEPEIEDSDLPF